MNAFKWKTFLTEFNRELLSYEEVVEAIYVRRGSPGLAWAAIESNLKHWWPVDHAQVTPLVLLTNEYLETLMTPERCQVVLSTPRGPEGAKAGKTTSRRDHRR